MIAKNLGMNKITQAPLGYFLLNSQELFVKDIFDIKEVKSESQRWIEIQKGPTNS